MSGSGKQGWKGHIDAKTEVVMEDIEILLKRAKDDSVSINVPRYLLGHSLGGLMVTYYALTHDLSELSGLICIGNSKLLLFVVYFFF